MPVTSDVEALWVQAVARLDDPDAQRAFIDACARTQQLPLAMRRYRGLSASDPRAQAPLERVTRIYTAMMMPPAPTLDEGMPRRLKFLIGAVLGGAALLALGAALLSG